MSLYIDLHIHSCLSPCADDEMTPNNIMGMAMIKGLNIIAITDHNTTENISSFLELQDEYGIEVIPGIEVTTKEEVHVLGYFFNMEDAKNAGYTFKSSLPHKKNVPEIFGHQLLMDKQDNIVGELDDLLIAATSYSVYDVVKTIRRCGGIAVPAHINRGNNGIIQNQGFVPEDLMFTSLEYSRTLPIESSILKGKHKLISSDAHYLGDILEKDAALSYEVKDKFDLLNLLKNKENYAN